MRAPELVDSKLPLVEAAEVVVLAEPYPLVVEVEPSLLAAPLAEAEVRFAPFAAEALPLMEGLACLLPSSARPRPST